MSSELGRRVAVVALAAALSLTVLAEPSFAGHGGEANSGTPDNADHFVDRNSVTGKLDNAVQHGIAQLDVSDMNATLSGSGDVEVYDAYYGTAGD
ncbi:MAG: hypothetical protein M3510_06385 [Actinomycetota bacterium]|jgi:hypothetical protein|nr:hypothetical protein [Actinomycetota bacterium]